ncbi:MAG: CRISPR-associated endonuclease Cas2 [Thiothrix sp.]|nr:CRISPR-associated endonuclease Cas2 [Thiothrix sp.]HPQ94479.1 CRISPR-associated endonuclease Cas2 [Thiolinea sp.]
MHTWLVCFDITDDRSRRRVGDLLEAYGLRVQRSVFEISVRSMPELEALRGQLQRWLEPGDDLRFYHLCAPCRAASMNAGGDRVAEFPLLVLV